MTLLHSSDFSGVYLFCQRCLDVEILSNEIESTVKNSDNKGNQKLFFSNVASRISDYVFMSPRL